MGFDTVYLLSILPTLAQAAGVNLALSVLILCFSLLFGVLLTVVRAFKFRPVNAVVRAVISFVRGTPVLIHIFIFYYVLPVAGLDLSPTEAGVGALSFNSGIFITEILRGGLSVIHPGQIEASTALGLSRTVIWIRIILPQVARIVLPALINEGTIIVKATALLSVITVVDVFRTAQQLSAISFRPFETLIGAAIIFVALNLLLVWGGKHVERAMRLQGG